MNTYFNATIIYGVRVLIWMYALRWSLKSARGTECTTYKKYCTACTGLTVSLSPYILVTLYSTFC
jgi:hypothetical protein